MKLVKTLNIKGAVLDNNQLEKYLEQIASDHILEKKSDPNTYPIIRLDENFNFITKTYEILSKHLKMGITIHPAGEWLLDNYYIIEETYHGIKKSLTKKKYMNFLGISNGMYKGYARIYVLASEIIAYTDGNIDEQILEKLLKSYQKKKTLNMEEIWNIGIFFEISLIEKIRGVCEKIYSSQIQKYKAESIIERLVEKKGKENQKFKITIKDKNKIVLSDQIKYPFIEYLSYRLKQYGKQSISYLNVLEEQVNKLGTTTYEVIQKEHFDIALKKVSIGNCIKSIKEIQRMNVLEIFEKINGVEEILNQDPSGIYSKMDYKTKEYYRETIKEISEKTKISEIYIVQKALKLAKDNLENINSKKSHIGYYLINDGINDLADRLQLKNKKAITKSVLNKKTNKYIFGINLVSLIISILLAKKIYNQLILVSNTGFAVCMFIIIVLISLIPSVEIVTQITQYFLGKIIKPKLIPKMDYLNGVPEEETTMVVIPTIIDSEKKTKELIKKLEVFYIANKSENIYFSLLGDCSSSKIKECEEDNKICTIAVEEINKLNKKYPKQGLPLFNFIYRKRSYNDKEECYLGWERKRGLLIQINDYLNEVINKKNKNFSFKYGLDFRVNTIQNWIKDNPNGELPNVIKNIITLDADTDLVLNSGIELIGAMGHILNKPELNKEQTLVVKGHALMQPRVGIHLEASRKSLFSKIFGGLGGTDSYTNAISDIYQDNFGEGIFTGKGIYNLEVFCKVLNNTIPDNTVLSHDLLEGSYLRCGLVSDILLMDGYPCKYNSFISRLHRWIRGDWQIIYWLNNKVKNKEENKVINPLNKLSKYKILDNLRRSQIEIFVMLNLIYAIILKNSFISIKVFWLVSFSIVSLIIPTILEILNHIVFKKNGQYKQKTFEHNIGNLGASIVRGFISFGTLPHKAYTSLDAIIRTLYRIVFSKKHRLEWTTSEEAESKSKTNLFSYYTQMLPNILFSIILFLIALNSTQLLSKIMLTIVSAIWVIMPSIMCYLSKELKKKEKIAELNKEEREFVFEIGKKTWNYFKDYMNEENNYLPPDNYQEDRKELVVDRTSSTNIGLALLCVVSAFDLEYIDKNEAIDLLEKMILKIYNLPKWNGHLYNWYNIKKLEPLIPRYVSTVDSGNFIGYLYTLKQFLIELDFEDKDRINCIINIIDKIIDNTDFKVLYDRQKRIFSIGYNIEENRLTDSYYDLLASEARQASLVAIAKKDVSPRHWNNLSRTLTVLDKYKGLISWSGTAFEYLMPNVNIKTYDGSLLDESSKFSIMSQQKYADKLGIEWGISESAFNLKDLNGNYQYKAFGVPWLGLKRGLADELVVAPYGSVLAINQVPKKVVNNLKRIQKKGMYSKYGFYEALDYTPHRLSRGKSSAPVKTYMAHHQALILLSINNLFHNNILQKRFMDNPEIRAIDVLLQERMPENVVMTKEKKEKIEKIKYEPDSNYSERIYTKFDPYLRYTNVIANENYTIYSDEKGHGVSKYKDYIVNRFKETADSAQGIIFYIKNIKSKKIWTAGLDNNISKPDKAYVSFAPDVNKFYRQDENIETVTKVIVAPEEAVEIRQIELKNNGKLEEILEVTGCFEPVLSTINQDIAHMAFNNLFLKYDLLPETNSLLIQRNSRGEQKEIYLATNFYTNKETIGDIEFEIDKEKLYENGQLIIPKMIEDSKPFSKSIGLVTNPIVAQKRTIKILPGESVKLNLIVSVGDEKEIVKSNLRKYQNDENVNRAFELSKVKVEEETRYLGISANDIEKYQKLLSYLILQNRTKSINMQKFKNKKFMQQQFWKYGISGDLPILLIKIKDVSDTFIIEEIIKAYEYFRTKNIYIDLVIMIKEENIYEQYVKQIIENHIYNHNLSYMKNIRSGIFVLNEREVEDVDLFEVKSNILIDSKNGNLDSCLDIIEEEYLSSKKNIGKEKVELQPMLQFKDNEYKWEKEKLKYFNEYGGFSEDGKEYIIKQTTENKLPTVWSHILANEKFGTLITNNLGGYTWNKNSRLNRLTAWNNNSIEDIPSEIIYIKDKDSNKIWSLGCNPTPDENDYYITYGFGYTELFHSSYGITQKQEIFIPKNDSIKVNIITLRNNMPSRRNLKIVYYIKPVMGEDELKSNGFIDLFFNKNTNCILAKNIYSDDISKTMHVSSNMKISSYTGNKTEFIGQGSINNPEGLNQVNFSNDNSLGNDSCIAIQIDIELESFETKEIILSLGEEDKKIDAENLAYKYSKINNVRDELENVKKHWKDILERIQVKTPIESTNIILNGWAAYQTIACRLWARSAFYQSGGAFGFRDQLQDTLGIKLLEPELMSKQIIKHSKHQFKEGDVEHWWHDETKRGIRTRFSDDLLWLPYVTSEYVEFTEDENILNIETPFIEGKILEDGEDEKYDEHLEGKNKATIYEHCIKAIEKSLNFGDRGLPKIGSGDWNDGMNTVGNKGKGESVWLGFFLYSVLDKFIPICEKREDFSLANKYKKIKEDLKKALNTNAWDGRWYKRAFMDNGDVLGSIENEECRIDGISQSWSVISNAGDNDKKFIAMQSLENHLVDKENGIIKLLDPPFEKGKLEPGYIKAYLPGVRENGGQYTHAAIWAIIATSILGFGDKAFEYFRMINPIEHARTKEACKKYKVEPYVIAADIYGASNLQGRGGWTWYTGSSSWLYKAGIEYLLGLKIKKGFLSIEPCIPKEWKEYEIKYKYKETIYNIKVKNPNQKMNTVDKFIVNGTEINEKQLKLENDGKIYEIEVIM